MTRPLPAPSGWLWLLACTQAICFRESMADWLKQFVNDETRWRRPGINGEGPPLGFAWTPVEDIRVNHEIRGLYEPTDGRLPAFVAPCKKWDLDGGGMWCGGQPVEEIDWEGLRISVPSDHLPSALHALQRAELQDDFGLERYALGSYPDRSLALYPADRLSLIAALESRAVVASERNAAFWAKRQRPEEALAECQGVPLDVVTTKEARARKADGWRMEDKS